MEISKDNLKNGGCDECDRAKYIFNEKDSSDIKVEYPYNFVYRVRIGNTIHKLCKDCLVKLQNEIEQELNE